MGYGKMADRIRQGTNGNSSEFCNGLQHIATARMYEQTCIPLHYIALQTWWIIMLSFCNASWNLQGQWSSKWWGEQSHVWSKWGPCMHWVRVSCPVHGSASFCSQYQRTLRYWLPASRFRVCLAARICDRWRGYPTFVDDGKATLLHNCQGRTAPKWQKGNWSGDTQRASWSK